MKRFFGLLFLVLLLNGCDDGNLTIETINFEDVPTQSCDTNSIIYKLNENEALLLQIPETAFVNEPTAEGKPTVIDIDDTTYRVVYRFYNGKVTPDNICKTIPPATPVATDQWTASSGKIEITTTTITKAGTIPGSTVITDYNHHIVFKNITFDKGNGTQVYETMVFGDHVIKQDPLPFGFDKLVEQCPNSKQIYNFTTSEAFTLDDLESILIVNEETPIDKPRTAIIGTLKNKLTYRLYSTPTLTQSNFCGTTDPTLPSIKEEWNGVKGVENVSGIIEVSTIKSGTTAYKHTIVIKKATLQNGNKSFKLGDSYVYGELITF
jgi:hypothetical protein